MPWMANPAFQGGDPITPSNAPITKNVQIAAITAGSFFFWYEGDWAQPDTEIDYVSKWLPIAPDIVPVPKATLSFAIRASIYEQTLPGVDASTGIVDPGENAWSEQIGKHGLDKWQPQYPSVIMPRYHRELSCAIRSGYLSFVGYSQAAGNWNANPFKTGLYPGAWATNPADVVELWRHNVHKFMPAAIIAGSFFHQNFGNKVKKDWTPEERGLTCVVEVPDYTLRTPLTLSQAIQAGPFAEVPPVNAAKTWILDVPRHDTYNPVFPDIIPMAKARLSEAVQAGSFTQPPYMPLGINWATKFFGDKRSGNAPDMITLWRKDKFTLPAAINAGSFFAMLPARFPAKDWAFDIIDLADNGIFPDIVPVPKADLLTAIRAGSFFYRFPVEGGGWGETIDPSNYEPKYPRLVRTNFLSDAIMSQLSAVIVLPSASGWIQTGGATNISWDSGVHYDG